MPNYRLSSTSRLSQLTGDFDPQPDGLPPDPDGGPAHVNFTGAWGVEGVDLGANVTHAGQLIIFFGDVPQVGGGVGRTPVNADLVAYATDLSVSAGRIALRPVLRGEFFAPFTVAGDRNTWPVGDPATMVERRQQHVFYRDVDSGIGHAYWDELTNGRVHDSWTSKVKDGAPPAVGDPATMVYGAQQHVFYVTGNGTVSHLFWDETAGDAVRYEDWTALTEAPTAAGNPASMVYGNTQHVFYSTTQNAIGHLYWDEASNTYGSQDWSASTHAPSAAGDPATMVYGAQQHVFFRTVQGAIGHLFWDQPSNALGYQDWSASTQAPSAAGDPATMVYGAQQHVFFRTVQGAIGHLFWDQPSNALGYQDWSASTQAPSAAGDPAAMVYDLQQHVFYRNVYGSMSHIYWDQHSNTMRHDFWDAFMPLGGETPTGAYSYDNAAWVFVWRAGSSSLTSSNAPTQPVPFQWHFSLSRFAGGANETAFLQVAPLVVQNSEFAGMIPSGQGDGVFPIRSWARRPGLGSSLGLDAAGPWPAAVERECLVLPRPGRVGSGPKRGPSAFRHGVRVERVVSRTNPVNR